MLTSAKQLYQLVTQSHKVVYEKLLSVRKDLDELNEKSDLRELADLVYVLRECEKSLEDIRKEVTKTYNHAQKTTCAHWTMDQMTKQDGEPIKTAYCTATPDIKMAAKFPHKLGKEGYDQLMKYLNVPDWVWMREVVRPHWPGLCELYNEVKKKGLPQIPGVDPATEFPNHIVSIRKNAGVTIL